jgi:hypothetical protein
MSAALCVAGALRAVPDVPPLRSAQFTFIGPAAGPLRIAVTRLRQGKNSVFVGVDLSGEAGLATRATLSFAASRPSALTYRARPMPPAGPAATGEPLFPNAQRPRFVDHFNTHRAGGQAVASGAATPDLLLWIRHKDPAARHTLPGLIALADALPPAAITMFPQPAPISTVTWSIDMIEPAAAVAGTEEGWHLMQSRGDHVADGYTSQDMTLWSEAGVPLLAARQTIAIFI